MGLAISIFHAELSFRVDSELLIEVVTLGNDGSLASPIRVSYHCGDRGYGDRCYSRAWGQGGTEPMALL